MSQLARFKWFLIAWGVISAAWFAAINLNLGGEKHLVPSHLYQVWEPYFVNVWYGAVGVIAALGFNLTTVRRYGGFKSFVGRGLLFMAIGFTVWSFGNVVWFWYNTCNLWPSVIGCHRASSAPYPSLADAGYLLLLPCYVVGLYSLGKVLALTWKEYLKFLWIPIIIGLITAYMTAPTVHVFGFKYGLSWLFDPKYTLLKNFTSSLYVASDIIVFSMTLIMLINARRIAGGMFFKPVLALLFALTSLYLGDMFFFKRVFDTTYYNGDISDVLYALSLYLVAVSMYFFAKVERSLAGGGDA
jgi:hypothetical protein